MPKLRKGFLEIIESDDPQLDTDAATPGGGEPPDGNGPSGGGDPPSGGGPPSGPVTQFHTIIYCGPRLDLCVANLRHILAKTSPEAAQDLSPDRSRPTHILVSLGTMRTITTKIVLRCIGLHETNFDDHLNQRTTFVLVFDANAEIGVFLEKFTGRCAQKVELEDLLTVCQVVSRADPTTSVPLNPAELFGQESLPVLIANPKTGEGVFETLKAAVVLALKREKFDAAQRTP